MYTMTAMPDRTVKGDLNGKRSNFFFMAIAMVFRKKLPVILTPIGLNEISHSSPD